MDTRIGYLWKKDNGKGTEYLSGVLRDIRGDIPIVIFTNKKTDEKQPDYVILRSEPKQG